MSATVPRPNPAASASARTVPSPRRSMRSRVRCATRDRASMRAEFRTSRGLDVRASTTTYSVSAYTSVIQLSGIPREMSVEPNTIVSNICSMIRRSM